MVRGAHSTSSDNGRLPVTDTCVSGVLVEHPGSAAIEMATRKELIRGSEGIDPWYAIRARS